MNQTSESTFLGHPRGLYILFFTELWERFSFYGMRAILVLYLTAETLGDNPGLGWTSHEALGLYGTYGMLVYFLGIFGGAIADRWLGQKRAVLVGGIFIILGQFALAIDSMAAFYSGLASIILGVGLLKPNISSMVGSLYKSGDARRDSGFYIFYIGINIGAVLAPLIVGTIGEKVSWHLAFSIAGFGMIIGQLVYVFLGRKWLVGIGDPHHKSIEAKANPTSPLTMEEKDRIIVMFISFFIVMIFWAAYEQAGGLMNLFARDNVDRNFMGIEIPTTFFQSLHAGYVVLLGAPMAWLWMKWRKMGKNSSAVFKMGMGSIVMSAGFIVLVAAALDMAESVDGLSPMYWLFLSYGLHVVAELCISPIALSFITKLAPVRFAGLMMGTYFAVVGLGNKAASAIGQLAQEAGLLATFSYITGFLLLLGILVLLFVKKLQKLSHGAEDVVAD